jgi:hypothetical protein
VNRARVWILGAALGSFAAGMSVGSVLPQVMAAENEAPSTDSDYVREMVATYGMSNAQERTLRLVLQSSREEEIAVLKSAEATQLPEPIQRLLLQARSKLESRIRALLDDEQRARYDRASRPTDIR